MSEKLTVKDVMSRLEDRSNEIICDKCPSCSSTDTKKLICKAGNLTICKACGQSWNYHKNFKPTTYKPKKFKENLVL